jgi:hypothetical protein
LRQSAESAPSADDEDLTEPDADADGEESLGLEGPPEEEFWEMYNKRLEFPLSAVATVFFHVVVASILLILFIWVMEPGEDRSNLELKLMQVGGLDDSGAGSAGSGGQPDPDKIADVDPIKALERSFATPEALADAKENIKKLVLDDPNGKLPIAPSNAAAFSQIEESLRKKLLGAGAQQGAGNQPGKGYDGTPGSGPGGTGADSTRARGLRWVLRFSVRGGSDYIAQLRSMGAEILIPLEGGKSIIIPNLQNPSEGRVATDADISRLAKKIQFSDNRRAMVREVIEALGAQVPGEPKAFWAFFPKEVEDDLARKEKAYRNRRAEDIEETVYRVIIRGGSYTAEVDDQVIKR